MAMARQLDDNWKRVGVVDSPILRRIPRALVNALIICAFVPALLAFAATTVPQLFGYRVMAISSGSMEPNIGVGDAVLIKPSPKIESIGVGDVITYNPVGADGTTTHRVIAVKKIKGEIYFQTKGDANATPDPNLVSSESVYGKLGLTLPKAGRFLYFSGTSNGKVIIFGIPALIITIWELQRLFKKPEEAVVINRS